MKPCTIGTTIMTTLVLMTFLFSETNAVNTIQSRPTWMLDLNVNDNDDQQSEHQQQQSKQRQNRQQPHRRETGDAVNSSFISVKVDEDNTESCDSNCDTNGRTLQQQPLQRTTTVLSDTQHGGRRLNTPSFFGRVNMLLSRWMNIIFRRNRSTDTFKNSLMSTNTVISVLCNYNLKFQSLSELLNDEMYNIDNAEKNSTNINNDNDDADSVVMSMYNASVYNMRIVSDIITSLFQDLQTSESIHITTFTCAMYQLATFLRDTTVPNIVSLTEVIVTKSNNITLQDRFTKYTTAMRSDLTYTSTGTIVQSNTIREATAAVCRPTTFDRTTTTTIVTTTPNFDLAIATARQNNLFPILAWLSACNEESMGPIQHLLAIVVNLILFPLSIVGGILLGLITLFFIVLPGRGPPTLLILTFGAPFFVILFILRNIRGLFRDVVSPMLQFQDDVARTSNTTIQNVMNRFSMVLDSPIQNVIDTMQQPTANRGDTNKEEEIECEIKALSCKNDAFLKVLPF
jgi:hypothetical protein